MDDHGGPVVLVEPFGPGGGPDVIARALAGHLSDVWGVPVVVDSRPGAGATAAPAFVATAPPDGRTLLINTSAHAYSAALLDGLAYDPIDDFVAIAPLTSQPYVLVAPASSGMRMLADLVGAGQGRPGQLRFASSGVGTGTHLSVEDLNAALGISAIHMPAGPTDAGADTSVRVAAGEADYAMAPISMAEPLLSAGTLVALGVSGPRRSRLLPDVPTVAEAGAAGFDFPIWYGIWAPSATPASIVSRLAAGIADALEAPGLRAWLTEHDADPLRMTQPEFARFVARETDRARRIAEAIGVALPRP
jgi:tripartite-type tricarboxylate transporter receptor subunit TctC